MKNWNLLFRRTHLYLGMILMPWLMMYALSTVLLNHNEFFRPFRPTDPQWSLLWEKDYSIDVPAGTDPLRAAARRILDDNGLKGAFGVQRQAQRLNINLPDFWHPKRLTYELESRKLRAEEKKFSAMEVLIRLHERTGYGQGGLLNNLWAVMVDAFCVTTLVWIGTGLYLWWKLPVTHGWGVFAIGSGLTTILILFWSL